MGAVGICHGTNPFSIFLEQNRKMEMPDGILGLALRGCVDFCSPSYMHFKNIWMALQLNTIIYGWPEVYRDRPLVISLSLCYLKYRKQSNLIGKESIS